MIMESYQDAIGITDAQIKRAEVALTAPQTEIALSDRTRAYAQLSHLRKARQHLVDAYELEPALADEGNLDGLADEYAGDRPR
jgi:hypothetical protein